jgi:RNA-directed DNA polymerase
MSMGKALHQMPASAGRATVGDGEAVSGVVSDEARLTRPETENAGQGLLAQALARENMQRAWKRVKANKGAAGVDGMNIAQTGRYLTNAWPNIRDQLMAGTYRPSPVRRVGIPKPDGSERELGIPTVVDRLIQQAVLQVLQPLIDPTFSQHSHGFRPGRRARDAVLAAQQHVQDGYRIVADVDLEKFFDRVNHDVLMDRIRKRVDDTGIIRLIRAYLNAGIMHGGVVADRIEGTPQGGPLSPLLANVLLDEVDRELEGRGHRFVRYADDSNVYVSSLKAGGRVMALLKRLYGKLHLTINESKSAVASAFGRNTRRSCGRSMTELVQPLRRYVLGWKAYFGLAQIPKVWRELDEWMRHRLRAIELKHWKRGTTAYRECLKLGASPWLAQKVAANCHRWWFISSRSLNGVLTMAFFDRLGFPRLS